MGYVQKYTKLCTVEGCMKKHKSRGWCQLHYQRWQAHGDPLFAKNFYRDDKKRFHSKVEKTDECWNWLGTVNPDGYGQFGMRYEGRYSNRGAHRYSYELFNGPTIKGMHVDHLCFNKKCVNPDHLELVTVSVNNYRRCARIKALESMGQR